MVRYFVSFISEFIYQLHQPNLCTVIIVSQPSSAFSSVVNALFVYHISKSFIYDYGLLCSWHISGSVYAIGVDTSLSLSLEWPHNERDGVSNHQPHDCLPNRLFRRRSKKAPKLRVTGLCEGNSPVTEEFPAQRASNGKNDSFWWRHHVSSWLPVYNSLLVRPSICRSHTGFSWRQIWNHLKPSTASRKGFENEARTSAMLMKVRIWKVN